MTKTSLGILLSVAGIIPVAIMFWKFSIDGYYPHEAVPFGLLGLVGVGLLWLGSKIYRAGKREQ